MTSGITARNRHRRRSLLRWAALLHLGLPRIAAADSPSPIDSLMQALASVPTRRGQFIETKTIAALSQPITSTGELIYRRPGYFAKITAPPHAEQLVVDGGTLSFTQGNEASRVIDLGSRPQLGALVDAIRGTLSGDLALLRRWYHVAMSGQPAAWRLTLTPNDPSIASLIRFIVIDGTGATPHMIQTVQANGDESRMTINPKP